MGDNSEVSMKKLNIIISLIVIGLLIGLYLQPNEINRYQLQNMFSGTGMLSNTIPKVLIDTKTGDVWVLIVKDGYRWNQIRGNKVENKE